MIITPHQSEKIKRIIANTYSEKLTENLLKAITPDICSILDIQYFATVIFQNRYSSDKILISNNPQEFTDVYTPLMNKDFILDNLVETGQPTLFRKLIDREVPYSNEFIHETQRTRPASDGCYIPIILNNSLAGFFGVARAGLNSGRLSDNDVEIFNFIASFLSEGLRKSLYPEASDKDTAYLNKFGEVVYAGERIGEAFSILFGEKYKEKPLNGNNEYSKKFSSGFAAFSGPVCKAGDTSLELTKKGIKYHLNFSLLTSPAYRIFLPKEPQYSVTLINDNDFAYKSSILDLESIKLKFGFTRRETEIIEYIYQGLSNREISLKLETAESTIKRHVWNIFNKTGVESRTQLIFTLSL